MAVILIFGIGITFGLAMGNEVFSLGVSPAGVAADLRSSRSRASLGYRRPRHRLLPVNGSPVLKPSTYALFTSSISWSTSLTNLLAASCPPPRALRFAVKIGICRNSLD